MFTGAGDTIFATASCPASTTGTSIAKASPLVEPVTGEILGYEATYLGRARVDRRGLRPSPDAASGDSDKAACRCPPV